MVNFELPNIPEDYVHRIGRTGRAGNEGEARSLVCVDEHKHLRDIERLLKRDIPKDIIPGYEPDPSIKPEPVQKGRGAKPQNSRHGASKVTAKPRQGGRPPLHANANRGGRSRTQAGQTSQRSR